jgi:hypothetical protein
VFDIHKGKVLGFLVSTKTIEANPDKIKALVEMHEPISVKDVQKLTGRVTALNRFIPRAVERSLPFFQTLRSSKNFQWFESQRQAFQELRDYLSNMTKLCPLEPKSPLPLYLSASNSVVSVMLVQEKERRRREAEANPNVFCFGSSFRIQIVLFRARKNSVCSNHGGKKAATLFRRSQNKSHHELATE